MRTASIPNFVHLYFKVGLIDTSSRLQALTFNHWQEYSPSGCVLQCSIPVTKDSDAAGTLYSSTARST